MEPELSSDDEEPPSFRLLIIFLLTIPLFIFFPFSYLLSSFLLWCARIGYLEDKKKKIKNDLKYLGR